MAEPNISVKLSQAEALVLFDWLARFNKTGRSDIEDQAEQRVLWDLEAMLEAVLVEPLESSYDDLLAAARAKVRDREGWWGRTAVLVAGFQMRAAIEMRIEEFLASDDPALEWLRDAVREHGFLPLYAGWLSTLGLRPDGSFVRWDQEHDPETLKTLSSAYLQRLAICQGSRKYPELQPLVPQRPASAETCEVCAGAGALPDLSQMICHCGGAGWIIPNEDTGPPTG